MSKKTKSAQTKATAKVIPLTESRYKCEYDKNGKPARIEFAPDTYVDQVGCYLWRLSNKKEYVYTRNELELFTYAKGWDQLDLSSHWKFNDALIIRNAIDVYFSLPCNRDRALLIPLLDELQDRYLSKLWVVQEVAA